jgi:hypothetical protein
MNPRPKSSENTSARPLKRRADRSDNVRSCVAFHVAAFPSRWPPTTLTRTPSKWEITEFPFIIRTKRRGMTVTSDWLRARASLPRCSEFDAAMGTRDTTSGTLMAQFVLGLLKSQRLAVDHLLCGFRITCALHRDLRSGVRNFAKVVRGQLNFGRRHVLL